MWKAFLFPSAMGVDFAGHSSQDWPLWLFKTGNALLEVFPAFKVSTEKSAVILIGLPLCVTCCFCRLTAFNIFSLLCILNCDILGFFFPGIVYLVCYVVLLSVCVSFLSFMILLHIWSLPLTCDLLAHLCLYFEDLVFSWCPTFPLLFGLF